MTGQCLSLVLVPQKREVVVRQELLDPLRNSALSATDKAVSTIGWKTLMQLRFCLERAPLGVPSSEFS
ncbi:MAG: hypothetical protein VW829_19945, partial [Deltaproteobacteria bacterium]